MKTDLYTKTILTVIAIALVANVIQQINPISEANAAKTDFNKYAAIPINNDGSINVKVVSDMDVNIRSVGGSSIYGALPINLKEIGGSSFYGALPMNLKEISGSSVSTSYGIPVNIEAVDGSSVYGAVPTKEKQ